MRSDELDQQGSGQGAGASCYIRAQKSVLRSLIAQWSVAAACAAHLEQRVLDGLLHNCLHASAPRRSHVLDGRVLALGWAVSSSERSGRSYASKSVDGPRARSQGPQREHCLPGLRGCASCDAIGDSDASFQHKVKWLVVLIAGTAQLICRVCCAARAQARPPTQPQEGGTGALANPLQGRLGPFT